MTDMSKIRGGAKIIDLKNNNLHIMGYSAPVDCYVSREELLKYVYVEESRPEAIPYVTSYYKKRSGFCMSKAQRDALPDDTYHIYIDSRLKKGSMTYGEVLLQSDSQQMEKEFFSPPISAILPWRTMNCQGPACLWP